MKPKKDKRTMHQKEIDRIYEAMSKIEDQSSEEYQRLEESLQRLADVQKTQKEATDDKRDRTEIIKVLITMGFSMVQIWLIMNHEELRVISTKALGFVIRGRV